MTTFPNDEDTKEIVVYSIFVNDLAKIPEI